MDEATKLVRDAIAAGIFNDLVSCFVISIATTFESPTDLFCGRGLEVTWMFVSLLLTMWNTSDRMMLPMRRGKGGIDVCVLVCVCVSFMET